MLGPMTRRLATALLLVALAAPAGAAVPVRRPAAVPRHTAEGRSTLQLLLDRDIVIDDATPDSFDVYLSDEEMSALLKAGVAARWTRDEVAEAWAAKQTDAFLDAKGTEQRLRALVAARPDITALHQYGTSRQGRPLWALQVTARPGVEEDEPEVRLASTMHGDELACTDTLMEFARRLVEGHGTDERITRLVDTTEIWILPLLNPDGREATPPSRFTSLGVDMNRNFPSRACGDANTTTGRQVETVAIMEWTAARRPVLAANLHAGALVVNYPFDECATCRATCAESVSPEDAVLRTLSLAYANAHPRLPNASFFTNGITNGAAWYSLYGGMQDWSYWWAGCLELTLEIEARKAPPASALPLIVAENQEPLMALVEGVHRGIRGVVTDGRTGAPVDATIHVAGSDLVTMTDPDVGDFHRVLVPGVYTLTIQPRDGRPAVVRPGIVVTEGPATRLDVVLDAPTAWMLN